MQQTQIVTLGLDGVLAERLRELAQTRRIWLRETSQIGACRNLVESTAPSVLVLVLGRDLEKELALLEQTHAALPETATIVVGETGNPAIEGLAWELGATYVVFPPTPIERVGEIIMRLLEESA